MTYRARCEGRKGRRGRRWLNLSRGTPWARTKPMWALCIGNVKLRDRNDNALAERIHAHIVLSEQSGKLVLDRLENPPASTDKLRALMQRDDEDES